MAAKAVTDAALFAGSQTAKHQTPDRKVAGMRTFSLMSRIKFNKRRGSGKGTAILTILLCRPVDRVEHALGYLDCS